MLCELRIENLALIESLILEFQEDVGLVVMTGETGAGKSIMLRAINLLTGSRSSTDWIRNGAETCTVEALFEMNPDHKSLMGLLKRAGLDNDSSVIIRRVINQKGRSRIYINGSLTTAKLASSVTTELLNMASQHDHQQLLQQHTHLDFIDTLGELLKERGRVGEIHSKWQALLEERDTLVEAEQDKEQRRDFLEYQVEEIRQAELSPGEDEELSVEKKKLKNAGLLVKLSQDNYYLLSSTILDKLMLLQKNMEQLAQLDPGAETLAEELSSYAFQAEDFSQQLRHYRDGLEVNPVRLDQVSERMDVLQQLKRKYGDSLEKVLEYGEKAARELEQLESMEQRLEELEKALLAVQEELMTEARNLSKKRKKIAKIFSQTMRDELASLAFNQSTLEVRWLDEDGVLENIRPTGWDRVEFFFSANPGEPTRPLAKVASGGELSRLMLAMKCVLAKKDLVDTVIFDEVDAGIGGEAAEAVARKIKELATHHQVFCITHLPQIAARGTEHFVVSKEVEKGRTQSGIKQLSEEERIGELGRMLAGDSATNETRAWAEQLLLKGSTG